MILRTTLDPLGGRFILIDLFLNSNHHHALVHVLGRVMERGWGRERSCTEKSFKTNPNKLFD